MQKNPYDDPAILLKNMPNPDNNDPIPYSQAPLPEVEEFIKLLMELVRDYAIKSSDDQLLARPTERGLRWRKVACQGKEALATAMIPDVADETLFYLLYAIDKELLKLSFTASNGKVINLTTDGRGELAGWFLDPTIWKGTYSRERWYDDRADIKKRHENRD